MLPPHTCITFPYLLVNKSFIPQVGAPWFEIQSFLLCINIDYLYQARRQEGVERVCSNPFWPPQPCTFFLLPVSLFMGSLCLSPKLDAVLYVSTTALLWPQKHCQSKKFPGGVCSQNPVVLHDYACIDTHQTPRHLRNSPPHRYRNQGGTEGPPSFHK